MGVKKLALHNSFSVVVSQCVSIFIGFFSRKILLTYLGIEILGINTTLVAIVSAASLAECGFGSAVIYNLYKPLQKNDYVEINKLLNIYRFLYTCLGVFIFVFALIMLPFLRSLLKGINFTSSVYVYFILLAANTSVSYFLSYKRIIFTADRRDFITKNIDTICLIFFTIIKLLVVFKYKSYILFIIFSIIQTIVSNSFILLVSKVKYKYLKHEKADFNYLRPLLSGMKDLFAGGFAAYLFSASDSIIISKFISTVTVGTLGNYTMVTTTIRNFLPAVLSFMGPFMGNYLAKDNVTEKQKKDFFNFFCLLSFSALCIFIVPEYVLLDDFIVNYLGVQYKITPFLVLLLLMDQYITIVQDPCGVTIVQDGKFKNSKRSDFAAAITNIISSLILVQFCGLEGVLIGTIIARLLAWILKSYFSIMISLKASVKFYICYWLKNFLRILLVLIFCVICKFLYTQFNFQMAFIFKFLISGAGLVFIVSVFLMIFILLSKDRELVKEYVIKR